MEVKVTAHGNFQKPKILTKSMKVNWNFWKCGGEARNKKPSVERVWILSGVTHEVKKIQKLGMGSQSSSHSHMLIFHYGTG